ncbi:MAG: RHS repeat-associated core domain-containing protein, partial [Candidatus Hadarchaeum sp.]
MEVKPNGTVATGAYDDQDRLLTYGDYTFTYTANGEFVFQCQGSACQHFAYDVFGNLRHVILDSGIEIEYLIDGKNRRIGKKINGTLVQGFVYDDQLRIVAELDGQNHVVSRFIYADHINVPEIIEKGGRTYRILHDHLGSPRLVIDTQTGEIAQELAYDAWGNVVYDSNPGFQPFGFAGGLYDPHTRLVRFGARDYDPQVGRWTSKDPAGASRVQGQMYVYASASPMHFVDPSGKWNCPYWLCGGGSVENDCSCAVIVFAMGPPARCEIVAPGTTSSGGVDWDFVVLPDGVVWKIGPGELDLG